LFRAYAGIPRLDLMAPDHSSAQPITPTVGWNVVHLFCKANAGAGASGSPASRTLVLEALDRTRKSDHQVVTASILGHKADLCVLALGPDLRELRALQTGLQQAGLDVADSYVSMTEVSEYAGGVPDALKQARLYPVLPPEGLSAFCFYPMSKRRSPGAENWYSLPYEDRLELMRGHGTLGREFRGRVLQLVTGSTGVDDFEWGVTLFGAHPDDLKDCVYTMRFDPASALYAEFGRFYSGFVGDADSVLTDAGVSGS
jgi:peroxiredoxin